MAHEQIKDYSLEEAEEKLYALTAKANEAGIPFRVLKDGKPRVIVHPAQHAITVPNLDAVFTNYSGGSTPHEDGFSASAGNEVL